MKFYTIFLSSFYFCECFCSQYSTEFSVIERVHHLKSCNEKKQELKTLAELCTEEINNSYDKYEDADLADSYAHVLTGIRYCIRIILNNEMSSDEKKKRLDKVYKCRYVESLLNNCSDLI